MYIATLTLFVSLIIFSCNYNTMYLLVVFAYKGTKKVHQIRTGKKRKSRKKKDLSAII